jgi:hypothetical protein
VQLQRNILTRERCSFYFLSIIAFAWQRFSCIFLANISKPNFLRTAEQLPKLLGAALYFTKSNSLFYQKKLKHKVNILQAFTYLHTTILNQIT